MDLAKFAEQQLGHKYLRGSHQPARVHAPSEPDPACEQGCHVHQNQTSRRFPSEMSRGLWPCFVWGVHAKLGRLLRSGLSGLWGRLVGSILNSDLSKISCLLLPCIQGSDQVPTARYFVSSFEDGTSEQASQLGSWR